MRQIGGDNKEQLTQRTMLELSIITKMCASCKHGSMGTVFVLEDKRVTGEVLSMTSLGLPSKGKKQRSIDFKIHKLPCRACTKQ